MKFKLFLLAVSFVFATSCSAQSFFKPIPKPWQKKIGDAFSLASDSLMNAFRPIVNVASFGLPGSVGLSGAGVSYQHLKFDLTSGKWNAIWSVNALAWYKVNLDGSVNNQSFAYGVAGGVFNNLLLVGAAYDGKKVFATVGVGISLNN